MAERGSKNSFAKLRLGQRRPVAGGQSVFVMPVLPQRYFALFAIIAAAIMTRVWRIGDPAIHMDEQFYLLVGDRMWQGALPYVDIWDRKPIGLFLIYAALRPFSPQGIVAYQLGAFASVVATALVIRHIGQRFASNTGATVAAVCYVFFLPLLGGSGGQAPVFYNLLIAISAWFVIRASDSDDETSFVRFSYAAMLFSGLALQVKYTVLFDGVFFGLWLLVQRWHRGTSTKTFLRFTAELLTVALAPTLLITLFYFFVGHFSEYFYANFISIFNVIPPPAGLTKSYLIGTLLHLYPLIIITIFSVFVKFRHFKTGIFWFVPIWSAFSIFGYFALGNNYHHYALPLLVPFSLVSAPLFNGISAFTGAATAIVWYSFLSGTSITQVRSVHQERIDAMVSAVRPYTEKGCLYVNDGPVILYLLTKSCLPTPYIFPEHLNNAGESQATQAPIAMARLLRERPSVIVVADKPLEHPRNLATSAILDRVITDNYHEIDRLPDIFKGRKQIIYARNDLE